MSEAVRTNGWRAWLLASRPKTLTGAAAPVLIGGALAVRLGCGAFRPWAFVWCLLFAFVMQVDANFVNDYFDWKKGSDREDRLGPERACAQGWVTPEAMRRAIWLTTLAGCLAGLPLVWHGGWWMVLVGALCVAGCVLYTTHLSYLGLGDVLVLVFFGLVPVFFTYWCCAGRGLGMGAAGLSAHLSAAVLGLCMGLVTDCLLMVNNYRDVEQDRLSGKRTFVVRFGRKAALRTYLWFGLAASAVALGYFWLEWEGNYVAAPALFVYMALHVWTFKEMSALTGRALNGVLGKTARNIFVFGAAVALSLLIG